METTSHLLSTHSSSIPKKQGGCWPEPCFPWVKSLASSGLESARQPDLATKPSLSVPHPLEWSTYKRKRWHFTSFSEILGWSGPKYQSQRTRRLKMSWFLLSFQDLSGDSRTFVKKSEKNSTFRKIPFKRVQPSEEIRFSFQWKILRWGFLKKNAHSKKRTG